MNKREKDRVNGKEDAVGDNAFITGKLTKNFTAVPGNGRSSFW